VNVIRRVLATPCSPGEGTTAHSVLTSHNTPVPTTPYSPGGGGTTAHSVLTSHNTPVPTTPYSPGGGGTTAHRVLTSHNTPVPTTPCSPGGGTTARSVHDIPQHTGAPTTRTAATDSHLLNTGDGSGRRSTTHRCPPPHIVQEEVLQHTQCTDIPQHTGAHHPM
jgi:hypothetical protein